MRKKLAFKLSGFVCLIIATVFMFTGCGVSVAIGDWLKQYSTAERNWFLVGEAKNTVESRTIVSVKTNKNFDFDNEVWEENITTTTVVREGYGENRKYYVKIEEKNISYGENETSIKEAYLGKISSASWMFYEYVYVSGEKPIYPTTSVKVASTASGYASFLSNSTSNGAKVKIFGISGPEDLEEHITDNIVNLDDFGGIDLALYTSVLNIKVSKNINEYKMTYNVDNFFQSGTKNSCQAVIKSGKFVSVNTESSSVNENINPKGDIEVTQKRAQIKNVNISYIGTVEMPTDTVI